MAKGAGLGYRIWVSPTVENALDFAEKMQANGGGAIINILGEHHKTAMKVEKDYEKYKELIHAIAERKKQGKFNAAISIKPSQLGLHLEALTREEREEYARRKL